MITELQSILAAVVRGGATVTIVIEPPSVVAAQKEEEEEILSSDDEWLCKMEELFFPGNDGHLGGGVGNSLDAILQGPLTP